MTLPNPTSARLLALAGLTATLSGLPVMASAKAELESSGSPARSLHPQDGPHADVRVLIDDTAVTFNIQMNLVFLDEIVDVPRENPDVLHEVEAPYAKEALIEFFATDNRVKINGVEVAPVVTDFEIYKPDLSLLALFPISGVRGLSKLRIALEYPTDAMPDTVAMQWGTYPVDILLSEPGNERLLDINAELTAEGLRSNIYFTSTEPEFIWHATGESIEDRFLEVPRGVEPSPLMIPLASVAAVLCMFALLIGTARSRAWPRIKRPMLLVALPLSVVGAFLLGGVGRVAVANPFDDSVGLPDAEQAVAIFRPLHANIYRAFDYTVEGDIYDALERSVTGDLLDTLYNQIYQSLIMYEHGGAVSRVDTVTPLEESVGSIGLLEDGQTVGIHITARWQVLGVVYHWGHSHRRLNEYKAEYTIIDTQDGWRIAGNKTIEQFRIELEDEPPLEPTQALPDGIEF